ncbi:MAG: hypothetical protein FWC40_09650 [Proteobacteria bacterium]|nr:hypothetical protein [Pseudomonadota bacterium]
MRAYSMVILAFVVFGCRSEADRLAEYCLSLEAMVVASEDCEAMAQALHGLPAGTYYDGDLCAKTTACLPCRKGAVEMLRRCGASESFRPLLDAWHFSAALRSAAEPSGESP